MEIILQEEVPALGREGDIVDVARGYANNYLIPKGMAVQATRGNRKQLELKGVGIEKRHKEARSEAQALADKLTDKSVTITAKAGEEGRLYGSVTVKDIAEAIQADFGIEVDKRRIVPGDPIKKAGEVTIRVRLQSDVEASLVVNVIAELPEGAEDVEVPGTIVEEETVVETEPAADEDSEPTEAE